MRFCESTHSYDSLMMHSQWYTRILIPTPMTHSNSHSHSYDTHDTNRESSVTPMTHSERALLGFILLWHTWLTLTVKSYDSQWNSLREHSYVFHSYESQWEYSHSYDTHSQWNPMTHSGIFGESTHTPMTDMILSERAMTFVGRTLTVKSYERTFTPTWHTPMTHTSCTPMTHCGIL